jgi:ubiquinone/menaquinone biosynthesis C-methylase UbiE
MPADYALLAPIYDKAGLSEATTTFIQDLFSYAQTAQDWVGRRALDMGTGTGAAAIWLAQRGLNVTGVDQSVEMLGQAQRTRDSSGLGLTWRQADIRGLDLSFDGTDLVVALDVVNDLNSLRDLEAMFTTAFRVLEPGKLLMFDMVTIEGLAAESRVSGEVHSDEDLLVFATREFDYDRQSSLTNYVIFTRQQTYWMRQDATETRRGFPVQAVAALLARAGFTLSALTHPNFEAYDPTTSRGERVIFFARKPGGGEDE